MMRGQVISARERIFQLCLFVSVEEITKTNHSLCAIYDNFAEILGVAVVKTYAGKLPAAQRHVPINGYVVSVFQYGEELAYFCDNNVDAAAHCLPCAFRGIPAVQDSIIEVIIQQDVAGQHFEGEVVIVQRER